MIDAITQISTFHRDDPTQIHYLIVMTVCRFDLTRLV